jgi:hypothetical protein
LRVCELYVNHEKGSTKRSVYNGLILVYNGGG